MAGQKMVVELHRMLERPDYASIARENEGEETTVFRCNFYGWDDIVPVDFTMTAETVQRRGADIKVVPSDFFFDIFVNFKRSIRFLNVFRHYKVFI
jgi:hypothetical protein